MTAGEPYVVQRSRIRLGIQQQLTAVGVPTQRCLVQSRLTILQRRCDTFQEVREADFHHETRYTERVSHRTIIFTITNRFSDRSQQVHAPTKHFAFGKQLVDMFAKRSGPCCPIGRFPSSLPLYGYVGTLLADVPFFSFLLLLSHSCVRIPRCKHPPVNYPPNHRTP